MEVDIELRLHGFPRSIAEKLVDRFPVEFRGTNDAALVVVRAAADIPNVPDMSAAILDFLRNFRDDAGAVRNAQGVLRLGIFYDLHESVVFPLCLSSEAVKEIAALSLEIDATGYPCAEENSNNGPGLN